MIALLLLTVTLGQTAPMSDAEEIETLLRAAGPILSVAEDEGPSAGLYRIWGLASVVKGELPGAILCFRQGLALDPADVKLRRALTRTRDMVAYPTPRLRPADALWPPWLALRRLGVYAFALYVVGCVAFTRWRMTRRSAYGWVALVALGLAAVPCLGSLLEALDRRRDALTPVVVVTRDVELRAGNGTEYPAKLSLPRGGEVRRLYERGVWLQVEAADGTVGWLPADAVVGE
ncbi:MAG: SH3 domain-containing protein [Gemmataceae bacterium]